MVVDLGAHCGHFIVLCHTLIKERFGNDSAQYIAIEGLAELLPSLRDTISATGLIAQVKIVHGLVGRPDGAARLYQR